MSDPCGSIFDVQHFSVSDGPGIRTTVFLKGCNLRCRWCHNPESQSGTLEMMLYPEKCMGCGRCRGRENDLTFVCYHGARTVAGATVTVDALLEELLADRPFYETSGGGVTLSGGECMLQIEFLEAVLRKLKENGVHTAVDTAGHVPYESFLRILPYTDLFLYDVKCMDSARHAEYTGVPNERILSNLARLLGSGVTTWVRVPVIPEVNDTVEEMERIRRFLDASGRPERIELLPYHTVGEGKYEALMRERPSFRTPTDAEMAALRAVFS